MFSSALSQEYGNLSKHALFVPLIYQMILRSNESGPLFQLIGKESWSSFDLPDSQSPEVVSMTAPKDSARYIPMQRRQQKRVEVKSYENLLEDGFYTLQQNEKEFGILAFNFNRQESKMSGLGATELKSLANSLDFVEIIDGDIEEIRTKVEGMTKGQEFWKFAIVLALLFIAIEIALIKLWKR